MIKIEVKKFVNGKGNKVASIVSVEGMLSKEKLPEEYISNEPTTWIDVHRLINAPNNVSLYIGNEYNYQDITKYIEYLNECGNHLKIVNQRIKKDIEEWTKNETFII